MAPVALEKIETAIKKGCQRAADRYEKITGGHWLSSAPESYIQSCIFEKIGDLDNLYATMETSHQKISEDTDISFKKKFTEDMKNGRLDLVVWYANGMPRVIIEIKKFYLKSTFDNDASRIRYWMENSDIRLQAGFLVGYTEAKGVKSRETLTHRFESLRDHTNGDLRWCDIRSDADDYGYRSAIGLVKIWPDS